MDLTNLHLTIVHLPLFGTLFGIVFLAYGLFSRNNTIVKAGFLIFVFTALVAIPTFLSGDPSKEAIKNLPHISEDIINLHEELAEKAIWLVEFLGAISLVGFFIAYDGMSKIKGIVLFTLLVAIITIAALAYVGNTGVKIRHSEIIKVDAQIKN